MSFVKLDPKCPDIEVRRIRNTDNDYTVKINGEVIPKFDDGEGNWSRFIYLSKRHRVVVKIDDDYYRQSRNEVVFWSEYIEGEHKRYFAPVLGWGTTSLKYERWISGDDYEKAYKKVFYCVQQYIWGAKEYHDYINSEKVPPIKREQAKDEYYALEAELIEKYHMTDLSQRQVKIDHLGRVKFHDYGLFRSETNYERLWLNSKNIPLSPDVAIRKAKSLLERI